MVAHTFCDRSLLCVIYCIDLAILPDVAREERNCS